MRLSTYGAQEKRQSRAHNSYFIVEVYLLSRLLCPRDVNPLRRAFVLVEQFVDGGQVFQGVEEFSSPGQKLD